MTGAPMPAGADAIVQVERTDGGVDTVRIDGAPAPGRARPDPRRGRARGAVVLPAGTVIGPTQVGVAAALGLADLPVRRPLRVLVLSTGSELVRAGRAAADRPDLRVERADAGRRAAPRSAPTRDGRALRRRRRRRAARGAPARPTRRPGIDLIVTSGGVSAGAYEVVKDALTGQGIEFAKVAHAAGHAAGRRAAARACRW